MAGRRKKAVSPQVMENHDEHEAWRFTDVTEDVPAKRGRGTKNVRGNLVINVDAKVEDSKSMQVNTRGKQKVMDNAVNSKDHENIPVIVQKTVKRGRAAKKTDSEPDEMKRQHNETKETSSGNTFEPAKITKSDKLSKKGLSSKNADAEILPIADYSTCESNENKPEKKLVPTKSASAKTAKESEPKRRGRAAKTVMAESVLDSKAAPPLKKLGRAANTKEAKIAQPVVQDVDQAKATKPKLKGKLGKELRVVLEHCTS